MTGLPTYVIARQEPRTCLYLASFDPTIPSTGTATRGGLFLRHLTRRYETHAVHFQEDRSEPQDKTLLESVASVRPVPYSSLLEYFLFSWEFFKQADRACRETKPDFIFADNEKAGLYAYLLSKRYGLPYVYNSHNVEYQKYASLGRTQWRRSVLVPYIYILERLACEKALLTVAISEHDASAFRRWVGDDKVVTHPCAFDERSINPFYEPIETERPIVLMVGNFSYSANREAAYATCRDIVPEVSARRPEVLFRFVGRDFPTDIKADNIESTGFVDDLLQEYAKASVIMAPIDAGGGIKIKVIEGLASGKYLLTTEQGVQGIEHVGLQNLRVSSHESFSADLVDALDAKPEKTEANWKHISSRYGLGSLGKLMSRIETELEQKAFYDSPKLHRLDTAHMLKK